LWALCGAPLSQGMGAGTRAARRHIDSRSAAATRGRAIVTYLSRKGDRRGLAPALLRPDQRLRPRVPGAPDAARLCPGNAFAALDGTTREIMGVVRLHADANYEKAEYAILIRSDLKGRGLGWKLMELMISYARSEGLRQIEGQVLRENIMMLQMCAELGFEVADDPADATITVVSLKFR